MRLHLPSISRAGRPHEFGFALVLTVSLLVLLSLIAVGLLSLSSMALRSSSHADALSTARANARLAMMMAIGELQRQAGADMRVTARADILDTSSSKNPPVLGVWASWQGDDHETTGSFAGRPKKPGSSSSDYRGAKMTARNPVEVKADEQKPGFLGWLPRPT